MNDELADAMPELEPEHDPACSRCGGTGYLELISTNGDQVMECPGEDEVREFDPDYPGRVV